MASPYLIGANSYGGEFTTYPCYVETTTNDRDAIFVGVSVSNGTVTGISDTSGNTYTLAASETVNEDYLYVYSCYESNVLTSGGGGTESQYMCAVPYSYPPSAFWNAVIAGYPTVKYAVANTSASGPGTAVAANFYTQFQAAAEAGIILLGYVWSDYGGASTASVEAQVADWYEFYAPYIGGILFDGTSTAAADVGYYTTLVSYVHEHAGAQVFLNCGAIPDQGYFEDTDADIICVCENTYANLIGPDGEAAEAPGWLFDYPSHRISVTINTCATQANMETAVGLSSSAFNAGLVYVTADGVYSAEAAYFTEEVTYVGGTAGAANAIEVAVSSDTANVNIVAVGDPGVSEADVAAGATGTTGTTATVSTGTLADADEHIVSFIWSDAAITPSAPLTSLELLNGSANSAGYLAAGYDVVTATTPVTTAGTWTGSQPWNIVTLSSAIVGVTMTPSSGALSAGIIGVAYSYTLSASDGIAPYTYSLGETLPTGLTLAGGVISGTPTVAGTSFFLITATDSHSNTYTASYSIVIYASPAPPPTSPTGSAVVLPGLPLPGNLLLYSDSDFEGGTVGGGADVYAAFYEATYGTSAGTLSWTAQTNASTPAESSLAALTGAQALLWQASAAGNSSVCTGMYPCVAGEPYIFSGYVQPAAALNCNLGVSWYNGDTLIATVDGQLAGALPGQFNPLYGSSQAPTGATQFSLFAEVQGCAAGDSCLIDLMYFGQCPGQVLVDWTNNPYVAGSSAGNAFMDVSMWVRMDTPGISMQRGRQDFVSEISAGSASFTLQNDTGVFTRGGQNVPLAIGGYITLSRRCQINLFDNVGEFHTRWDGPIAAISYTFDDPGQTAQAAVSVTDVFAYLNRQEELLSWTEETVLNDGPFPYTGITNTTVPSVTYHWPLTDAGTQGDFGVASETSGNNGPLLTITDSDTTGAATIGWADTTGGVETLADASSPNPLMTDGAQYWPAFRQPTSLTRGLLSGNIGPFTTPAASPLLTPVITAQANANQFVSNAGFQFNGRFTPPLVVGAYGASFEVWFMPSATMATTLTEKIGPYIVLSLGSSRSGGCLVAGIYQDTSAVQQFKLEVYVSPPAFAPSQGAGFVDPTSSSAITWTPDTVERPHHLVVEIFPSTDEYGENIAFAFLDGVLQGALTVDLIGVTAVPLYGSGIGFDTICVGGAFGGHGAFFGNISQCTYYPYALSEYQVTAHCQNGQYGMWEETTDSCVAALANFASIPSFWNGSYGNGSGLSLTDYIDITGSSPLDNMQLFEQAEQGLLWVSALGQLNFTTRDWRMGYGAPDLYLPPDSFGGDMGMQVIDQFLANTAAVSTAALSELANSESYDPNTTGLSTASFTNTVSQEEYGPYGPNPPSQPLQLPAISWSRAYATLGLPQLVWWPNPVLSDLAQWQANHASQPYLSPGLLNIDILTLSAAETGVSIADLYALDIGNMVAPSGTLPAAFPSYAGDNEWFIEGINETFQLASRTLQFYTSPANLQRAWIPGDEVYGVLGTTTMVGVSAADVSFTEAYGKDVSHDAGPPTWPPVFSSTMNNPSANSHAFIGALEMRGLWENLQQMLTPPICVVGNVGNTPSVPTGFTAATIVTFDTVFLDTAGGMGVVPGYNNWYCCLVPGFYDLSATVPMAAGTTTDDVQAWIVVAQQAAQAVAAGTATPLTVDSYICPIGEAQPFNAYGVAASPAPSTRMYLGLGDMVGVACQQDSGGGVDISNLNGGPRLSLLFRGLSYAGDRCEVNNSLAGGGTTTSPPPTVTYFEKTYVSQNTYSYYGPASTKGGANGTRANTNGYCYQGLNPKFATSGSMCSQITIDTAQLVVDWTGATITGMTLEGSNASTYNTSGVLMVGWSEIGPGAGAYNTNHTTDHPNQTHVTFTNGTPSLTFNLPSSFFGPLQDGDVTMFIIGDSNYTSPEYAGAWNGGPGWWTLTVTGYITT